MKTYVILLRGVMPTGRNKVPMAPLRLALENAGLKDVQTYIQSGNVVARSNLSQARLEKLIHDEIAGNFGGDIIVIARAATRFSEIVDGYPFVRSAPAKRYFTLLAAAPEANKVAEFEKASYAPDKIRIIGDVVYTLCATQYSDLKINNNVLERRLGLSASTRNFNTMTKLVALSSAA